MRVAPDTRRSSVGIAAASDMRIVGRRGDRQHLADRLNPVGGAVIVNEGDHRLNGRSSSAWAKYAEALRRISLACRSSRFSRSSAFSRSAFTLRAERGGGAGSAAALDPLHPKSATSRAYSRSSRRSTKSRPARGMLRLVLQHHPHRPLPDFRRKLVRRHACHGSILSRVGASGKAGAVQAAL